MDNYGGVPPSLYSDLGLDIDVSRPGKNLGWTGALLAALPRVTTEYVMFLNDDTEFEIRDDSLAKLLSHFEDADVAAVGPATGIAMGRQAVGGPDVEITKLLIGFCVLLRKSALEAVGGVNDKWPLGDDVDLCIRFNKAGKKMVIDRRVFVYHHGFKTGTKIYGSARKPGGWNSEQMVSEVYQKLILEHGVDRFYECLGVNASLGD